MSRLIVVSNRVADPRSVSAGGLAVGVREALKASRGIWFGWSGKIDDSGRPAESLATAETDAGHYRLITTDLTAEEHAGYYEGYANATLWPLFHGRVDLARFDDSFDAVYHAVNRRFARQIAAIAGPDDIIWVHDYHLIPLGRELRALGLQNRIGFFLHTPFPAEEAMETIPNGRQLVESFSAYDLVGVHIEQYAENLRRAHGGPGLSCIAVPIGIDMKAFESMAASEEVAGRVRRLNRIGVFGDWIVGVDRLDYTKGLCERFKAVNELFETNERFRERVNFVQIAAPSRETVPEYRKMRQKLEGLAGRINGHWSTVDWVPLRFINRSEDHVSLAALYRFCRVGLVTPLRDGMNMVAKEYLASQNPENPGVLVLSRFAGAAEELTDAVLVNPHDVSETAAGIARALSMGRDERIARWNRSMEVLRRNDIYHWRERFLGALAGTGAPRTVCIA